MWGGVNGALPMIKQQIDEWPDKYKFDILFLFLFLFLTSHFFIHFNRDRYAADLKFLQLVIWPDIQHRHIAHDSYCCNQFTSTR